MAVPQAEPRSGLTPERWERVQEIFHAALEREAPYRAAFLDQACLLDAGLRVEVDSLLSAEPAARGFLASATDGLLETLEIASPVRPEQTEFRGSERFVLRRTLGSGGFGTVYEAYDREQNDVVALKRLHRAGASEIYRFKREFRSLCNISHPNLASLYELLSDGEHWFFTMEMVDGTHFLNYVRGTGPRCNWTKLRMSLAQLAAGVHALHQSGRLHRDLKPSNVLITTEGRVVIVDFGLITDAQIEELRGPVAGTPAYMAPELLETGQASTATDWYSVGMVLFEALTGRLPSIGEPAVIPSDASIPQDLANLCEALLRRNPRERPAGQEVLKRLDAIDQAGGAVLLEAPWVGREQELSCLAEALEKVARGSAVVVTLCGGSGIGKTALLHQFLDQVRYEGGFVTLAGRCYEQESVPYKGLDEIADALAAHLQSLTPSELQTLTNPDTALAARLFSVLEAYTPPVLRDKVDSQEVQQAAFASFRTLLKRLSDRKPLVLCIDDLHWANADTLQLLTELVRPPSPPNMLLVVAFRSDVAVDGDPAGLVTAWQSSVAGLCDTTQVHLGQLPDMEARRLASMLLPDSLDREEWATRIAQESAGNPFLLGELVQHMGSGHSSQTGWHASIEEMVQSRVLALPESARRLLEVVAVARQPLESQVAWKAAQYDNAQQSALGILRAHHLIRVRRVKGRQEIEPYHDRVRKTIEASLPVPAREHKHLHLARELEASGRASPETLAVHFREGQDRPKAFQYSITAAESAFRALAFERAVHWYQLALSEREDHSIRVRLADALSNSGRGREAAGIYLDCVEAASIADQLELRRKAATELVISGHLQEGLKALADVLKTIGMRLPISARRAMPSLLLHRALIQLRGLKLRERSGEISAKLLQRDDACWSVTRGLAMVDTVRAVEFHSRSLLLSLGLGDAYRASRALSIEAGYCAQAGNKAREKTQRILELAARLSESCDNPHALGLTKLVSGMAAFLEGRWATARDSLLAAETFLRENCEGVVWELATARFMHCVALSFLGEIKNLSARLPLLLGNARARGDLHESTDLQVRVVHLLHLASDRPELAADELQEAISRCPKQQFYLQHWWGMIAGTEIALYRGDARAAWQLVHSQWSALRRSMLMRVQYVRLESFVCRALAALALARTSTGDQRRLLRVALSDANKIEQERVAWATPLCGLIRAGAAALEGRQERALLELENAETGLRSAGMMLLAAAARRRRGEWTGGDEGATLISEAEAWMKTQNICNTERMAQMLVPSGLLAGH